MESRFLARSVGALLALAVAAFAYVTTESLPVGLLSLMSGSLRVPAPAIGLLVTAYGLVVVVATIPLAHATRRVPRRPLLTVLLVAFVLTTVASAAAPSYPVLLAARVATALSQALFWALVVPAAAALVPAAFRGRAIAVIFAAASLAGLAGVPAGSWLGEQAGWRAAFVALAIVGAAATAGIAVLLPGERAANPGAGPGRFPDAVRYRGVVLVTVLATAGAFTAFTYVVPLLADARFAAAAIAPLLLVRGVGGVAGAFVGGRLGDRNPERAFAVAIALQVASLLGLAVAGGVLAAGPVAAAAVAIVCLATSGLAFSILTTALGILVLDVAPVSLDLAAAGTSTGVNVGIAAGALIGGLLLPAVGASAPALAGALLSVAALAVAHRFDLVSAAGRRARAENPMEADTEAGVERRAAA